MARLLILLLLTCAMPSHARWEQATKNPRGDLYYLDTQIVQKGSVYQVWCLVDLIEPV